MLPFFADSSGFTQVSTLEKVAKAAYGDGVGGGAEKWAGRDPGGADSGRETRGPLGLCTKSAVAGSLCF